MDDTKNPDLTTPMSQAVLEKYRLGEDDEAMEPMVLDNGDGTPVGRIEDGDYVIFYDIRGEREVELTEAFVNPDFHEFEIPKGMKTSWATMIEYDPKLDVAVAYPTLEKLSNTLCDVVSRAGLKQAKVVETEKAVHLGFFFNGKRQEFYDNETRDFVPTPKDIDFFDKRPQMEAEEVADRLVKHLGDPEMKLLVGNFANVDVVGHIENDEAVKKAVQTVDRCAGRVIEAARRNGVATIVIADHGTVEKRKYPEGSIDTGHTDSPVPFILVPPEGCDATGLEMPEGGSLISVAPTALELLGLEIPEVMTGKTMLPAGFADTLLGDRDRRVLVMIVDGFGIGDSDAEAGWNLIKDAGTPVLDVLMKAYPWVQVAAHGRAVGLPKGTVGNSESGHLHIGAGRVVYSDRLRIEADMESGDFGSNEAFCAMMDGAKKDGTALHLLGIVSFFSSHGSLDHLYALMDMAKERGVKEVYIHGLLGRRGERPEAGARYVNDMENKALDIGLGKVSTVIGRHWALDREENWDRIEKTYRALVHGDGMRVPEQS